MTWRRFFRRAAWDTERARELEDYLAQEIDDNLARGLPRGEAIRAAHRKLGNVTRIREDIYDMNTLAFLDQTWQDVRFGARLLAKHRAFSVVAILTLALGTGANAAIFQVVNAVRLRTLPVERPGELVAVGIDRQGRGRIGMSYRGRSIHTEAIWDALSAEQQAFSSIAAWGSGDWDVAVEGEAQRIRGFYVSGTFFETLGVAPYVGRVLGNDDDRKGCGEPPAVLSYGYWQSRFGGDHGVLGRTIMLERRPIQVVGVTPPSFFGVEVGRGFDAILPICAEAMFRPRPGGRQDVWWLDIVGRLKPGWTIERAGAHLDAISPALFGATVPPTFNAEAAQSYKGYRFTAAPADTGVSTLRTTYAAPLWVLLGATALVLLITCANLANLMLARATARTREIAVRLAIGASRGRIVRQLLSESLLIAGLGAAAGTLLAQWLSRGLVSYLSTAESSISVDLAPDWRVFAFVALIAAAACLAFGLSPALEATRTDPGRTIQSGGRSATDTHGALTMRRGLVVLQVALSLVLIVGAVLFGRTLRNLATLDLGFRADGIVAANVDLRRTNIKPEARAETYERMLAGVRTVPGVERAAEAFIVPLSGPVWNGRIAVGGEAREGLVYFNQVGYDYFRTLEIPLVEGRTFEPGDRRGGPIVVVVNETFARRNFPGASPLGRTFQQEAQPGAPQPAHHIVGVVKDSKYTDLREPATAMVFLSWSQEPVAPPFGRIIVRSSLPLASLRGALTQAVVAAAPGASISYDTITSYVYDSLVTQRIMASLSGFFGVLAMLIASVGLYGVMSYLVTQRQVEIGIRMALGADPGAVVNMVLKESGLLLAGGVAAGLALALFVSRYAEALLFGLQARDPLSFASAAAVLAAVSLLAAWIPARRASRVAPTVALRPE